MITITSILYPIVTVNLSNAASKDLNPLWPTALPDPRLSSSPRGRLRRVQPG